MVGYLGGGWLLPSTGGAIGAVISCISTSASDRRKAAPGDEQRWDSERLTRAGVMLPKLAVLYETNLRIQDSINDFISNGHSPESPQSLVLRAI
jgi:hypothetical protein